MKILKLLARLFLTSTKNNKSILYYLSVITIFTLPYMNFPFVSAGTIKPLALLPLSLVALIDIKMYFKKSSVIFFVIFFILILYSLFLSFTLSDEVFNNKPLRGQYVGLIQFILLGFFSYLAYYMGRFIIPHYIDLKQFLKFTILAYYPSLIFGIIHILTVNFGLQNPIFSIRSFVSTTVFPADYYRNMMLTVEPSFAAADLMVIMLPISLMSFYKMRNIFSAITLVLVIINLLGTKSGLGFVMLASTVIFLILINFNRLKSIILYIFPLVLFSLVAISSSDYIVNRMLKAEGQTDQSMATRYVSYSVGKDIFLDNPLGVGYANEGFYYAEYLPDEYTKLPLFSDWIDPESKRFPDIKSILIKFLVSFGIIGIILICCLCYFVIRVWLRLGFFCNNNFYSIVIKIFIINVIIMSLSVSVFGYISIVLLSGYYLSFLKLKGIR